MHATSTNPTPPLKTLVLAIVAPFGAIALLATPLVFDALLHTFAG